MKSNPTTLDSILAEFEEKFLNFEFKPHEEKNDKYAALAAQIIKATYRTFLKEKITALLEEKAALIEGEKKEYHNRQFHDNCYDCIDVTNHNAALDLAAQIIRSPKDV